MYHFINSIWITDKEAKISVFDLAVLRGFGVFDFLRTYNRQPFLLNEHLDRFFNSIKILGLKPKYSKLKIKNIITEGIKRNPPSELSIRIIQTGGVSQDAITPSRPNFMVLFKKAVNYPKKYYTEGIKLITTEFSRVLPEAKTLNYTAGVIALEKARKQGAVEALYTDKNYLYECVTSNFFAVIDNILITPKDNILIGTVRNLVLKIAQRLNIKHKQTPIKTADIKRFQEAFITASNKEIMPVVQIDGIKIGKGKPGKITKILINEYKTITQTA
ncbi:MAG: branched chain amino acid aminotransferase [Patescibacteria group bacterium]|nr:MAG: branched chain amino acid aminotransferase [Patescibacteria group bacterium]